MRIVFSTNMVKTIDSNLKPLSVTDGGKTHIHGVM